MTFVAIGGYDGRAMGAKAKGDVIEPVPVAISDAERRRAPRVLLNLEVDYASEDNFLFAYITDISATGIFVRTTTPEDPGTQLNLKFGTLEVEGQVIWVNPYRPGTPDNLHPGMGIRFEALDDDVRDRLLELIRRFAYLS